MLRYAECVEGFTRREVALEKALGHWCARYAWTRLASCLLQPRGRTGEGKGATRDSFMEEQIIESILRQ